MLGDECFVGDGAVVNPGVKVYPFKTVEAGAVVTSSIVWESRGARTLFGRRGVARARQRRHHLRGRDAPRDGLRHVAEEGLGRHHEPRHEPGRPRAQAGDHRRAQPHRRQRRGPRARHRAAHPVPGAELERPHGGISVRLAAERPRQRRDPLLRQRRRATSTRRSQRKIERLLAPRGLPPRVRGRHRRHRVPAPRARVLHRRAGGERRQRPAARRARSRSCSTTRSAPRRS